MEKMVTVTLSESDAMLLGKLLDLCDGSLMEAVKRLRGTTAHAPETKDEVAAHPKDGRDVFIDEKRGLYIDLTNLFPDDTIPPLSIKPETFERVDLNSDEFIMEGWRLANEKY